MSLVQLCIRRGADAFLIKPLRVTDIRHMWQFVKEASLPEGSFKDDVKRTVSPTTQQQSPQQRPPQQQPPQPAPPGPGVPRRMTGSPPSSAAASPRSTADVAAERPSGQAASMWDLDSRGTTRGDSRSVAAMACAGAPQYTVPASPRLRPLQPQQPHPDDLTDDYLDESATVCRPQ